MKHLASSQVKSLVPLVEPVINVLHGAEHTDYLRICGLMCDICAWHRAHNLDVNNRKQNRLFLKSLLGDQTWSNRTWTYNTFWAVQCQNTVILVLCYNARGFAVEGTFRYSADLINNALLDLKGLMYNEP